jgi:hypothetical protein
LLPARNFNLVGQDEGGEVAVFDATNTTQKRRRKLYEQIVLQRGFKLFFVESICNDKSIIESNIKEVKVSRKKISTFYHKKLSRVTHVEGLQSGLRLI